MTVKYLSYLRKLLPITNLFMALCFIVLVSSQALLSQQKFTMNEAIRFALLNHPDIKQADYNIKQAESITKETTGNAFPSLDLSASYSYTIKGAQIPMPDFAAMLNNSTYDVLFKENLLPSDNSKFLPIGTSLMSMQQKNNLSAQLQLTQILFNSAVFKGISVSKDYLNLSRLQYNSKINEIVYNIKKAFSASIMTKEILAIINSSYENAKNNLKNVRALYEEGLIAEYILLDAEVQVENIKPQIKQTENAVIASIDALKLAMGLPQTENIDIIGSLEYTQEDSPNLEATVLEAQENNFNLQLLKQARLLNEASIAVSEAGYYPTLAAFANYGVNSMGNSFRELTGYNTSMAGISFSMNLFKGYQTQQKVEQSKIEVYKTDEQIRLVRDAIYMQVKTNINELDRITKDISSQERNVEVAERAYTLSTVRLREGTGSQLEVFNSELSLRRARTNLLQSIYDYTQAKYSLDNILGRVDKSLLIEFEK